MGTLRPEWREQARGPTGHQCRACAPLVSKPGGSFIQSLAHLFASSTVLPIFAAPCVPCSAKPGVLVTSFSYCLPSPFNHLQILLVPPSTSKYISNVTFSPWPLPPASSKPGDAPPLGSLCSPWHPCHPLRLTQPEEPAKNKSDSFPPLHRILHGSCLTQSKSRSFPKPTRPCTVCPWLRAALAPFHSPLAHSGSATLASLRLQTTTDSSAPEPLHWQLSPPGTLFPQTLHGWLPLLLLQCYPLPDHPVKTILGPLDLLLLPLSN